MKTEKAEEIASLNDAFRRSGLGVMVTPGVRRLDDVYKLIGEIRRFNSFTDDNDPYGEHDFGVLHWRNEKVFWKIDYFDQELKYGSDPLASDCRRVLVVMLASEY